MRNSTIVSFWFFAIAAVPCAGTPAESELAYPRAFFPGATYANAVPTPEAVLGFGLGERAVLPREIEKCLRAWDAASPNTRLVEYARSYEGRPLFYMIITSKRNMQRLETIQAGWAKLADPRSVSKDEADKLADSLPGVGWFAYSIHGDETSGSNAALALIHHLAASTQGAVSELLEDLVVIIDPLMNPDGRALSIRQRTQYRGSLPNLDSQSILHEGFSPSGRTNHYLFDMNRDWLLGVHPESKGRLTAIASWNPLLLVDAHEMGPLNTYLFSPATEPLNPNIPEHLKQWSDAFAQDQAQAFDRFGWRYYNGEWNEDWYVGYSTSWGAYHGAVSILYEQAAIDLDGVRRPEGTVVTYAEGVHHQIVSSMANLATLKKNRQALARDYLAARRRAVDPLGPYTKRTFAVLPTKHHSRLRAFVDLMRLQGIEIYQASKEFVAPSSTDQLGRVEDARTLPAGTILVPNRQPLGPLVAAILEFDPKMAPAFLQKERREILRHGESRLYDVTAWNMTMMYGLEGLTLAMELPSDVQRLERLQDNRVGKPVKGAPRVAYMIDGTDDAAVAAAARLLERGVEVRIATKEATFDGTMFARGSLAITKVDNPAFAGNLGATVNKVATDLGLRVVGVSTGFGPRDLVDMGGRYFKRLEQPRIAVLCRGGISDYDFGTIWFTLDHRLGIQHSPLDAADLAGTDLRSYNVLILPSRHHTSLSKKALEKIVAWVKSGGTLIAIGGSARDIASAESTLGSVRLLPDVLEKLDEYELAVLREWLGRTATVDHDSIYGHATDAGFEYPWSGTVGERPPLAELKRQDQWQKLFMPQGAFLSGRVEDEHWLTFGVGDTVPVLFGNAPVLMTKGSATAAVRLGTFLPEAAGKKTGKKTDKVANEKTNDATKNPARIGWAAPPPGHEMRLRMSGLLWPEAAQRLANAAWATREQVESGQVILFASTPNFRASTLGTARLLLNAMIYGPGLGAKEVIRP